MHGGETAPRFNAPPSLCWSLRGVGPHPGGQPSSASPSTVHVLLLLLWVLRPTAPSRCQPRGGEAPSPKRELDPQNRLCCRSGRQPRTFVPPRAAIGIHTQIPFPCMGIRAARSPVFCPCCAWGAMVSPAEPSCNVEHKRSALHRWLGLGLLPTPPLQTVPKLALVLSRSSRGQEHRMHTAALGAPRFAAWASGASAVLASHTKGIQNKQQKAELICAWRMQRISPLFATDR